MKLSLSSLSVAVLGVLPLNADESWSRITTADRRGADTTIGIGDSTSDHSEQPLLGLHQNMPATDVGQKIYLGFDLSALADQRVATAHLTLQPVAGYDARYDFNVFGLDETTNRSDVAWFKSDRGRALTWGNAPAHDPSNTGGPFEINDIQTFEEVEQIRPNGEVTTFKRRAGVRREVINNGGVDIGAATYLGRISIRPGNNRSRLVGDALANFLNLDRDGLVTIVLTRATPADQPIVFASSEHPLFDPPSLWVQTEGEFDLPKGAEELLRFELPDNPVAKNLYRATYEWGVKAFRTGWIECIEEAEEIYETLNNTYGQDDPASVARLVVSLADLVRTEIAFKGLELIEDEWAERVAQILSRHPDSADDLIYAFYLVSGWRMFEPKLPLSPVDLEPLLKNDLTPLARQTVMEFMVDVMYPPGKDGPLTHYRALIPVAYGKPTTPYIIHQYAAALQKAEGTDAVLAFLDQTAALKADAPMGQAASVLRVSRESDSARKTALIAQLVESGEGESAQVLRPYYLTAQARNGQLLNALSISNPLLGEKRSSDPEAWGRAMVEDVYETFDGSDRITLFPKMVSSKLDLGDLAKPFGLCADQAGQLYEEEKYLDAAAVALGLITRERLVLPGIQLNSSVKAISDLMPEDSPSNRQATAAMLLHVAYEQLYEGPLSRKYLREASSVSATGQTQAMVLLYQAIAEAQRGELDKARTMLDEAVELVSVSTALTELRNLIKTAGGS